MVSGDAHPRTTAPESLILGACREPRSKSVSNGNPTKTRSLLDKANRSALERDDIGLMTAMLLADVAVETLVKLVLFDRGVDAGKQDKLAIPSSTRDTCPLPQAWMDFGVGPNALSQLENGFDDVANFSGTDSLH